MLPNPSLLQKCFRHISTKTPPPFGGGAIVAGYSVRSADRRRHAEMLLEEGDRAAIGELGGLLVIARIVGVVVEGVLGAFIHVLGVDLVVGLQRGFER